MSEIEDNGDDDDNDNDEEDGTSRNRSDEEEDSESVLEEDPFDDDFFKVYGAIKNKDPEIYEKNKQFFVEKNIDTCSSQLKKKSPEKKMTLQEYHWKIVEEKNGITEDDIDDVRSDSVANDPGYYEELYNLRQNIKKKLNQNESNVSDEDENDLFTLKPNRESDRTQKAPKSVPKFWCDDEKLDDNEKFLKNYILQKQYCEDEATKMRENHLRNSVNYFKIYDDEDGIDENVERKIEIVDDAENEIQIPRFHFEEPDAAIIKRYPRNISSLRNASLNEEKTKRADTRARKRLEKQQELKRLRKMKREEIEKKIKKLKSISNNERLDIEDLDLNIIIDDDNDFDSDKYDQKMRLLFGDDYYEQKDQNDQKPKFDFIPGIDDVADEDLIPKNASKRKKDIKDRKDIMADDDIGFFEDIINGQIATRFKYRMVEPNDFGLTDEEILFAEDKELNKWCSLKKMSQYRTKETEVYDRKVYGEKAKNLNLKKTIFKSLYNSDGSRKNFLNENYASETTDDHNNNHKEFQTKSGLIDEEINGRNGSEQTSFVNSSKRRKRRKKSKRDRTLQTHQIESTESSNDQLKKTNLNDKDRNTDRKRPRKRRRIPSSNHQQQNQTEMNVSGVSLQRLKAYGVSNRELKRIKKRN
ncbi:major abundant protein [Sarcoptes scabiei]|nr:major abundant protein [Sarcoptes scabiei]